MVLITPHLVRPLDPDEVPELPTDRRTSSCRDSDGLGAQLQGGGGTVDAPNARAGGTPVATVEAGGVQWQERLGSSAALTATCRPLVTACGMRPVVLQAEQLASTSRATGAVPDARARRRASRPLSCSSTDRRHQAALPVDGHRHRREVARPGADARSDARRRDRGHHRAAHPGGSPVGASAA